MSSTLTIGNPIFAAYAVAAVLMILKLMGQGWMTVALMVRSDEGFLNREDFRASVANRARAHTS